MINQLTLIPKTIEPERLSQIESKLIASLKQARGLLSLKISDGPLMSPAGPPAFVKVIEASWESLEDMMAWTQTPAAQGDGDKDFLIENGAVLLFYEIKAL